MAPTRDSHPAAGSCVDRAPCAPKYVRPWRPWARATPASGASFSHIWQRTKSHPTAEEVYQAVRHAMPRISLATVYKALEALVAARLATKLTSGDASARYDCRGEDHYHLRDVATGEVRDLPAKFDPDLLDEARPAFTVAVSGGRFSSDRLPLGSVGTFSQHVTQRPNPARQAPPRHFSPPQAFTSGSATQGV